MTLRNWWNRLTQRQIQARRLSNGRFRLEELETRCLLSVTGFRPIDESGNNQTPGLGTLGTAGTELLRVSDPAYTNGFNTPSMGGNGPLTFVAGPRLVSNAVSNQATTLFGDTDVNTVNSNGLSDFGYAFGQFMDHDMDLTPDQGGDPKPNPIPAPFTTTDFNDGFNVPADATHPRPPAIPPPGVAADPIGSLLFSRSRFDTATGTDTDHPREQINVNTAFLDLSQVYGSTTTVANALRTVVSNGQDGLFGTDDDVLGATLKTSPGNLLPFNNTTYFSAAQIAALHMANDVGIVSNDDLFAAGDVRANETTELSSLHTLFMRNHNRLAAALAQQNPADFGVPSWTDETLYQEARKLNIAQYQNIVYNGYLPALLGPTALPTYSGYDSTVNPSIANEFSTVAFRFGHSLLNNGVPRDADDGSSVGDLTLVQSFFNPHFLTPGNTGYTDIGAVLKGDADNNAQEMDVMAVSSIRNLLFGNDGVGEDLISRDIWRAHDNGIGTYNQVRAGYFGVAKSLGIDLSPISETGGGLTFTPGQDFHGFEQITSDTSVQAKLVQAYTGPTRAAFLANNKTAGDIDPFAAGIAEDHVSGSTLGPLFHTILVDQFTRLRNGDRFFYLNQDFTPAELSTITVGNTLANVIKANTTITNLQDDVFHFFTQEDGKGKGYYTNKNGQNELTGSQTGTTLTGLGVDGGTIHDGLLAALRQSPTSNLLVLVDASGNYLPTTFLDSYASLKSFLQDSGGNMANKLSMQLLVTEINILLGKVDASSSISVPAVTLPGTSTTLSSTLQSSLTTNGVTDPSGKGTVQNFLSFSIAQLLSSTPDANLMEALKDCLDAINSNEQIFILS